MLVKQKTDYFWYDVINSIDGMFNLVRPSFISRHYYWSRISSSKIEIININELFFKVVYGSANGRHNYLIGKRFGTFFQIWDAKKVIVIVWSFFGPFLGQPLSDNFLTYKLTLSLYDIDVKYLFMPTILYDNVLLLSFTLLN